MSQIETIKNKTSKPNFQLDFGADHFWNLTFHWTEIPNSKIGEGATERCVGEKQDRSNQLSLVRSRRNKIAKLKFILFKIWSYQPQVAQDQFITYKIFNKIRGCLQNHRVFRRATKGHRGQNEKKSNMKTQTDQIDHTNTLTLKRENKC